MGTSDERQKRVKFLRARVEEREGRQPDYTKFVGIGIVRGETAAEHVRQALERNGISSLDDNLRGYVIQVAPKDVDQAKDILRQDSEKKNYRFYLLNRQNAKRQKN